MTAVAIITAGLLVWMFAAWQYGWRLTIADVIADALLATGNAMLPGTFSHLIAAVFAVAAARSALALWRRRRKRKRALRELGAKSRARLAALVTALRERSKPRRVLRPLPQGAGR